LESTALVMNSQRHSVALVKSTALFIDRRSRLGHDGDMNASVSARELARANVTAAIKTAARRRVAVDGAAKLSVRAVARDVGMVSSAVYRYFPTRDDLLTALIIDAYDALGNAVELADAGVAADDIRARWRVMCMAVRDWARAHPHEYALIYGSPIPDYHAPQDTIGPAARLPTALFAAIGHGWSIGAIDAATDEPIPARLEGQLHAVAEALAPDMPPAVVLWVGIAWTQLFGMVTFELFGQFKNTVDPADDFFETTVGVMADFLGLA
jgi:AcrR family transcriptional regulator